MENRSRAVLRKFSDCVDSFQESQTSLIRLFQNAANIQQRLPYLRDVSNYQGLGNESQVQQLVLSKQTVALENVKERIMSALAEMETSVSQEERLVVEFLAAVSSSTPSSGVSMEAATTLLPEGITVAALVESVENLWRLNRDQLCQVAAAAAAATAMAIFTSSDSSAGLAPVAATTPGASAATAPFSPSSNSNSNSTGGRGKERKRDDASFAELAGILKETVSYAVPYEASFNIVRTTLASMAG